MSELRQSPRVRLELECTLRRPAGSPIPASTCDLGPGGMLITTRRPLTIDEVLSFDLALLEDAHVDGQARVLRQQGHARYALRFESLADAARARLRDLAQTG